MLLLTAAGAFGKPDENGPSSSLESGFLNSVSLLSRILLTGANRHDVTQVEAVLKSRVRKPRGKTKQNLCADAGYQGKESEKTMKKYRYTPHIRPRGEEKKAIKEGYKARRWIVEVAHSWFNRFRKLLVRFEKTTSSYLALLQLAASIIILRKIASI